MHQIENRAIDVNDDFITKPPLTVSDGRTGRGDEHIDSNLTLLMRDSHFGFEVSNGLLRRRRKEGG
jgi:hypothetical protein